MSQVAGQVLVAEKVIAIENGSSASPGCLLRDTGRLQRHGRKAQVWALDEIASVIRCHPILAAAKDAFPGAQVVSV